MKNQIFISASLLAVALSFSCCNNSVKTDSKSENKITATSSSDTAKTAYSCPMHPEVKSDKPGSCSQCGMDLEKINK
ncbi:MAG TPA: heavy metal-binding domain-containing protein [Bacteroidia bacterium]